MIRVTRLFDLEIRTVLPGYVGHGLGFLKPPSAPIVWTLH